MRTRLWFFRALSSAWILVAGLLIAGLAGELWLRLERRASIEASARFRESNVFLANARELNVIARSLWARRWFKYRPGARMEMIVGGELFRIEINSRGYRTHEFAVPKPEGLVRVVCIGASTTVAGRTNEETYPALLEAKLRARNPGLPLEVLNLGVSGVTTEYWHGRLDRVFAYEPDVIVEYQAINDICWRHLPRYAEAHPWRGLAYRSLLLERLFPLPIDELEPLLMETLDTLGSIARACRERGIGYLAASFAAPDPRRTSEEFRRHLDVNTESWTRRFPLRSYETYAAILERYNRRFVYFARRDHHGHVLVHEELSDPDLFIDVCHFTPEGIERLAEVFLPAVEELVRDTPDYRRWTEAAEAGPNRRRH